MTPGTDRGPALLMKGLGQRYVQHVNRTYTRTGTLFEGRLRDWIIEADTYLFVCRRYMELNPMGARMTNEPGDYPWSSYGAIALGHVDPVARWLARPRRD